MPGMPLFTFPSLLKCSQIIFIGSNLMLVDNQQFITRLMPYCFSSLQKPISFKHNTFSLIISWDCLSNRDSIKPMFNGCACVSHLADKRKIWDTLLLLTDSFLFMVLTCKSLTITLILYVCGKCWADKRKLQMQSISRKEWKKK